VLLLQEQQHHRRFHSNCDRARHPLLPAGAAAPLALLQPSERLQAPVPSPDG
jgi:hypothetical protein